MEVAPREVDFAYVLASHARAEIALAACELWPGLVTELGEEVPSVTSYVYKVCVGGRQLFAKYSYLGVSLASVLRGEHGGWGAISRLQASYLNQAEALHRREASQITALSMLPMNMVSLVGVGRGVLFTEVVQDGKSLDDKIFEEPQMATTYLRRAWHPLRVLHGMRTRACSWSLTPERCVSATFERKFRRPHGALWDRMAWAGERTRALRELVGVLCRISSAGQVDALMYGDFKPEHVLFRQGGDPVYLDPGVSRGSSASDLAKLYSRILLRFAAVEATPSAEIVEGMTRFLCETAPIREGDRVRWLHNAFALLAKDVANTLSTYLSSAPLMPLPHAASLVIHRAERVSEVVGGAAETLLGQADPMRAWEGLRSGFLA